MQEIYLEVFNKIHQELVEMLKELDVVYDIQHVGGSSIPGVITKGDIDICVITNKANIDSICSTFTKIFPKHHPELWTKNFALWHTDKYGYPVDLMLVVKGTSRDNFVAFRDILKNNTNLIDEYNIIKKQILGADKQTQRDIKIPFIKKVLHDNGYSQYE